MSSFQSLILIEENIDIPKIYVYQKPDHANAYASSPLYADINPDKIAMTEIQISVNPKVFHQFISFIIYHLTAI
jgi:hypothetical protein